MNTVTVRKKQFDVSDEESDFWRSVCKRKWEPSTYVIFDEYLDAEHTYIDMGSWIGPTVLYGAQIAKHCFAVEPDVCALAILKENIQLNPSLQERITLYEGCIGTKCGTVPFGNASAFGNSASSMLVPYAKEVTVVKSLTFDAFIKKFGVRECNFIKMDIEGGEVLVLPTMKDYIAAHKPTLHVSLHPFVFKHFKVDVPKMIDVFMMYTYVFTDAGIMMNRDELIDMLKKKRNSAGLYSIVVTDKESRCQERLFMHYRVRLAETAIRRVKKNAATQRKEGNTG